MIGFNSLLCFPVMDYTGGNLNSEVQSGHTKMSSKRQMCSCSSHEVTQNSNQHLKFRIEAVEWYFKAKCLVEF